MLRAELFAVLLLSVLSINTANAQVDHLRIEPIDTLQIMPNCIKLYDINNDGTEDIFPAI